MIQLTWFTESMQLKRKQLGLFHVFWKFFRRKNILCLSKKRSLTDVDGRDLCPTSFLPRLANMSRKSLVIDWLSSLSLKSCREAAWSPWILGIACERRHLHLYLYDSDSSSKKVVFLLLFSF